MVQYLSLTENKQGPGEPELKESINNNFIYGRNIYKMEKPNLLLTLKVLFCWD